MKKIFILICLLFSCVVTKSQYFSTGQDRFATKWRQINTTAFQIIFPDYYEPQAQRIAKILDSIPTPVSFSLPAKLKRISLLLHVESVKSNGMVVWAPKRMEWWTVSPQEMYSQPWFEQLGIHEYRHVLQMENVTEGFSGALAFVFGEHITGAIVGLFVPQWFLEGDATATETALSETGRGREADFAMKLRAQINEKGIFSYNKAAFGSYYDFVPNHYELGYHLAGFGREKYGDSIWKGTLKNVARKPWQLNPFERGIKKTSSYNMNLFYNKALKHYDSIWNSNFSFQSKYNPKDTLVKPSQTYTQYFSPKILNNDSVLVLKNSFEELQSFTLVSSNKKEKIIRRTGNIYDNYFDKYNNQLVWAEIKQHSRWENVSYSDLVLFDLGSHKREQLTKNMHYFSPSFSPNGKQIVCISADSLNRNSVILLDIETKKTSELIDGGFETTFSYPVFSDDGKSVYVIALKGTGKSAYKIHIESQTIEICIDPIYSNIAKLKQRGNYLFHIGEYEGISQVFALELSSGKMYQLTHALYGVSSYDVSDNLETVVYNSYTSNGYILEKENILFTNQIDVKVKKILYPVAEAMSEQEQLRINFDTTDTNQYDVNKYHRWAHLFNFHSWAPVAINPTEQTVNTGVSFMSQNILNTSFLELGFAWNDQEGKGNIYANYSYRGFYPIISTALNYNGRQTKKANTTFSWNELVWSTQLRIPFNYSKENLLYGISPFLYYDYKKIYPLQNVSFEVNETQTVKIGSLFYIQQAKPYKNINPRWGQAGAINFNRSFSSGRNAWMFSIYSIFFIPSVVNTHSISFYSGYQYNKKGSIIYSNQVSLPRGYKDILPQSLFSNKANYTLPLLYPDLSLGRFLYIKRIYTTLFYDFMWYEDLLPLLTYNYSFGSELYFDINLFRFDTPISTGVRVSCLGTDNSLHYDFLFSFKF